MKKQDQAKILELIFKMFNGESKRIRQSYDQLIDETLASLGIDGTNLKTPTEICDKIGIPYTVSDDGGIEFSTETLDSLGLSHLNGVGM